MKAAYIFDGTLLFGSLTGAGMWASMKIGSWLFPYTILGAYMAPLLVGVLTTIVAIPLGFLFVGVMACLIDLQRWRRNLLMAALLIAPVAIGLYELDMSDARPILESLSASEYMHENFFRDTHGDAILRAMFTTLPAALVTTTWLSGRMSGGQPLRQNTT